jgi:hypothetical protein
MTAKEKAQELIDKYLFVEIAYYTSMHEVKQCALIAVDEVLYALSFHSDTELGETYWNEVKKEIEAL